MTANKQPSIAQVRYNNKRRAMKILRIIGRNFQSGKIAVMEIDIEQQSQQISPFSLDGTPERMFQLGGETVYRITCRRYSK